MHSDSIRVGMKSPAGPYPSVGRAQRACVVGYGVHGLCILRSGWRTTRVIARSESSAHLAFPPPPGFGIQAALLPLSCCTPRRSRSAGAESSGRSCARQGLWEPAVPGGTGLLLYLFMSRRSRDCDSRIFQVTAVLHKDAQARRSGRRSCCTFLHSSRCLAGLPRPRATGLRNPLAWFPGSARLAFSGVRRCPLTLDGPSNRKDSYVQEPEVEAGRPEPDAPAAEGDSRSARRLGAIPLHPFTERRVAVRPDGQEGNPLFAKRRRCVR